MSNDDLLQPTIATDGRVRPKPWRIQSQFYVCFFGGPIPGTLIAFLNAKRLHLGAGARRNIVLAGLAATVAFALLVYFAPLGERPGRTVRTWAHLTGALLWWLALSRIQRPADLMRNAAGDAEYASLWGPGLASSLLLGAIQNLGVWALTRL
ncbi:MAG TPA: hypothetical protein VF618_00740 [Thermoanaerobaculia bacterium]